MIESRRTFLERRLLQARRAFEEAEACAATPSLILGGDDFSVRRRLRALIAVTVDVLCADSGLLDAADELAELESAICDHCRLICDLHHIDEGVDCAETSLCRANV